MGESGNPWAAMVMIMPHYFLNVSLEDHLLPDPEGQELPDPDAAWETARRIALEAVQTCHYPVRLRPPPEEGDGGSPMLFDTAAAALAWLGVIVFAVSGALVASRKQMDIVGFALLGTVTGIGGGTLRDLLLGLGPVFWVREPAYLIVCVVVSGVVFVTAHVPQSSYRVLLW